MLFIYIFIYIKKSNFHAFSSVECIFDFVSHNIFVLVSLSIVFTHSKKLELCFFLRWL